MAIITIPRRAGIAKSIKNSPLFIAWGMGDPEWTGTEKYPEDAMRDSLFREVGRRAIDSVVFCVGDDEGDIITPSGRWRESETPTNNLFIRAAFDFSDANGYIIREYGLFANTITKSDLPEGKRYFALEDIEDPGELLMVENCAPLIRTGDTRQECNFVMSL